MACGTSPFGCDCPYLFALLFQYWRALFVTARSLAAVVPNVPIILLIVSLILASAGSIVLVLEFSKDSLGSR